MEGQPATESCLSQRISSGEETRAPHSQIGHLLREGFSGELEALSGLCHQQRIGQLTAEFEERDRERAERAVATIAFEPAKDMLSQCSCSSWMYRVAASLWQVEAYLKFLQGQPHGAKFSSELFAPWVRDTYGYDQVLWFLYRTQIRAERDVKRWLEGTSGCWFFTDEENKLIPDFYKPVNCFVERLVAAGIVTRSKTSWTTLKIRLDPATNTLRDPLPRPPYVAKNWGSRGYEPPAPRSTGDSDTRLGER